MAALQGRTLHRRVKNSHERANRKFTAALLRAKRDKALQAPTIVAAVAADDRDRELGRVYRRVVREELPNYRSNSASASTSV